MDTLVGDNQPKTTKYTETTSSSESTPAENSWEAGESHGTASHALFCYCISLGTYLESCFC